MRGRGRPSARGLGLDACDLLGGVGQRLAPQAVHVGFRGAHGVGGVRGPAERDHRPRLLHREHVGDEVGELVVGARVIERLALGPHPLHDLDVLAGAVVALVVAQEVALALLFVVVAAGDEVHREPAAADLVERREGLGRERRDREVRAVREQHLQRVGVAAR